jgi:hypothetical protein
MPPSPSRRLSLFLELDLEGAGRRRAHVHPGRRLHVGMAELEHDFGRVPGPAVLVDRPAAQDERVVVEVEVRGVEEEHLADLVGRALLAEEGHVELVGRVPHQLREVGEAVG